MVQLNLGLKRRRLIANIFGRQHKHSLSLNLTRRSPIYQVVEQISQSLELNSYHNMLEYFTRLKNCPANKIHETFLLYGFLVAVGGRQSVRMADGVELDGRLTRRRMGRR